jgi:hypothetical protein
MPKLPTQWVVIGTLVLVFGLYKFGHHKGWTERDAEMQVAIATANQEAREREHKLTEQINQTSTELRDANDVITQKQSSLDRAIRAGRVRLPAAGCVPASASATAPSGDQQAGSESDRETLAISAQIPQTETEQSSSSTPASTPTKPSVSK